MPKPGSTFTKTITRGPNKGDRVAFKTAPGGHPYPTRVLVDKGGDSTLRDNSIPFGKKKKGSVMDSVMRNAGLSKG